VSVDKSGELCAGDCENAYYAGVVQEEAKEKLFTARAANHPSLSITATPPPRRPPAATIKTVIASRPRPPCTKLRTTRQQSRRPPIFDLDASLFHYEKASRPGARSHDERTHQCDEMP